MNKKHLLLLCLCIAFISCQTIKDLRKTIKPRNPHNLIVRASMNNVYEYNGHQELPMDSIVYRALLKRNGSFECARRKAYNHTNMQLLTLMEENTDFTLDSYKQVQAIKYNDTIEIEFNFGLFYGGNMAYFAGKPINIKLFKNTFSTTITHTSDALTSKKNEAGEWEQVPFPTSEITYDKIELNQSSYQVGDTIKGYLSIRSIIPASLYQSERNEITKGQFRVIVEDKEAVCKP